MLKVVIVGFGGKMGTEIARLISLQQDLKLVGGVEVQGHSLLGTSAGSGVVVAHLKDVIDASDVVVDFSVPDTVISNVRLCLAARKPFITGVTGFNDNQLQEIKDAGKTIPLVYAPNFAVGIAVLSRIAQESARLLGKGYDINLIEIHHKKKRDAPSGTAKMLLEKIGVGETNVFSLRIGEVVGEHRLIFGGAGERLELIHRAENRTAFAWGVITAIRWIIGKPAGFYSMSDILQF
ncbi:MAG: 4-hydroxy-tetrahydrodipicolinate reductase [bacterium]